MIRRTLLLALCLAFSANLALAAGLHIVPIIGQSNAVGHGFGSYVELIPRAHLRSLQLGRYGDQDMQMIPAADPLHHVDVLDPSLGRIGFATTFASYLVRQIPMEDSVLLIPAAKNGSGIMEWQDGGAYYDDMIRRTRSALEASPDNRVAAILWQQGETDIAQSVMTSSPGYIQGDVNGALGSLRYAARLGALVARLRRDIPGDPPILMGLPAPSWGRGDAILTQAKANFIKAMTQVAGALPRVAVISGHGLTANCDVMPNRPTDCAHYSATGQIYLGWRYFRTWRAMP